MKTVKNETLCECGHRYESHTDLICERCSCKVFVKSPGCERHPESGCHICNTGDPGCAHCSECGDMVSKGGVRIKASRKPCPECGSKLKAHVCPGEPEVKAPPEAEPETRTCGCLQAGVILSGNVCGRDHIERCDACGIFETDEDAQAVVQGLVELLGRVYETREGTPEESLEFIERAVNQALAKKARKS